MWKKFSELGKQFSWSLFGNLIYAFSQWIIVTMIAKIGPPDDLGIYTLGLAITAPIVLFFNFQLRTILATDSKNGFAFTQYFGGRIIHLTLAFIIIIPVAFIYSDNVSTFAVIVLMGLVKFFESLSDICLGYLQKNNRIDIIGKSQFYRGILSMIFVGAIYYFTGNIVFSVAGLLIVMIIRFLFYDLKRTSNFGEINPTFDISAIKLIKLAYPLGFVALINSLNANIPKYVLDHFSGTYDVGVFSALSYILIAGNMLILPISLQAAPRLANAYAQTSKKYFFKINIQLSVLSIMIFLILLAIIIFQGDIILGILYGDTYAKYHTSFVIICIALLFSFLTTFYNLSIVVTRYLKMQPLVNTLVTLITVLSSVYFIKSLGILGASYSTLISMGFQTLLSLILLLVLVKKK
ncbi:oligosaccharide flippase family protein [Cytobacillus depressus]|uniref:Oligosaccharide flippase family protein n=1 Tax=Cytobacillus depressus TaxID=1602942 RepID=A0A6L3VAN6_9BACI|nr:oligosaccharide flippase family protein [Cytobacillus depressus]KAB2336562.1 oligosaccharide flippase family protein [Cytobacillus depressus]